MRLFRFNPIIPCSVLLMAFCWSGCAHKATTTTAPSIAPPAATAPNSTQPAPEKTPTNPKTWQDSTQVVTEETHPSNGSDDTPANEAGMGHQALNTASINRVPADSLSTGHTIKTDKQAVRENTPQTSHS